MESRTSASYLRKNLEFTNPVSDEITDILFRSTCA
jgi:hypothetical protein